MPLQVEQVEHARGSIADAERRLTKARLALALAATCLAEGDPAGARSALADADAETAATREEIRAGLLAFGTARRVPAG